MRTTTSRQCHAFAIHGSMSAEQMRHWQEGLQREADEVREHAEAFVESVVSEVDHEGVKVQTLALQDRHPADALVEQSEGADMLVVGSRGLGGFAGLVVGSVSQQCLHHAKCPVVVIRASRLRLGVDFWVAPQYKYRIPCAGHLR
jgi:nucleotide-binding universal stress UspA family protein